MEATSHAGQDYLKAVYALTSRGEPVTTGGLAHELGVSSPSVTAMLKRLEGAGLVERPDARTITLTARGRQLALKVVRRHRLVETFLVTVLDVPWDEVHSEAELLEHAVSSGLEERIDRHLGHPARDPHGDPIPPASGEHDEAWGEPLDAVEDGATFVVERVSDRDSAALRYLGELGIRPDVVLHVEEQTPFGGPRWIRIGHPDGIGERQPLGGELTGLVHGRVDARGKRT